MTSINVNIVYIGIFFTKSGLLLYVFRNIIIYIAQIRHYYPFIGLGVIKAQRYDDWSARVATWFALWLGIKSRGFDLWILLAIDISQGSAHISAVRAFHFGEVISALGLVMFV